jgi:hypothetical protein
MLRIPAWLHGISGSRRHSRRKGIKLWLEPLRIGKPALKVLACATKNEDAEIARRTAACIAQINDRPQELASP